MPIQYGVLGCNHDFYVTVPTSCKQRLEEEFCIPENGY